MSAGLGGVNKGKMYTLCVRINIEINITYMTLLPYIYVSKYIFYLRYVRLSMFFTWKNIRINMYTVFFCNIYTFRVFVCVDCGTIIRKQHCLLWNIINNYIILLLRIHIDLINYIILRFFRNSLFFCCCEIIQMLKVDTLLHIQKIV